MEPTVLNRLIAARHLIQSSGPSLTAASPALLVAQKLLVAHDASELVFLALSSTSTEMAPKGKDGQAIKDPSFVTLAQSVVRFAVDRCGLDEQSQQKTFEDLNEARKFFKHSGMLVDASSHRHLVDRALQVLDELCSKVIGQPLLQIDQSSAISSDQARSLFTSSRNSLDSSDYKSSLELTAQALASVFWEASVPTHLIVGKPSSDEALLLSGRGVDPASFLSMQQFLPLSYVHWEKPTWDQRKYGHQANWTHEVAEMCLETAIDTAVKLQSTPSYPTAIDFYSVYEDVVEVTCDSPEIYLSKVSMIYSSPEIKVTESFIAGDKIYGRASGRLEREAPLTSTSEMDFEFAEWIAIENARTERLEPTEGHWTTNTLWVRKDQTALSYQTNEEAAKVRAEFRQEYDSITNRAE